MQFWLEHKLALQKTGGQLDVEVDQETGLKKILNVENVQISKKSQLQDRIENNREQSLEKLGELEHLQKFESQLNEEVRNKLEQNKAKETAIKTQVYQLRLLQQFIGDQIEREEKREQAIEQQS